MNKKELITTHINADFDAIASLIGAKKLYPSATVFFPGSQEKSAKDDFVRKVLEDIDAVKQKNINLRDIKKIIIVDTRNPKRLDIPSDLFSKKDAEIIIYDHHPYQEGDLVPHKLFYQKTGSTTTIITLILREKGISLTPDEATIMLTGIYEDTGNLTYESTSPDDYLACSFLLSQGGNLKIVRNLLSREISKEEIKLLNEMLSSLKIYSIYGIDVGISTIFSEDYIRDFAVIVQKVKDIENLPVMFGIGSLGDRIIVSARSRLPEVDVSRILARLGGGGHAFAGSAVVKDLTTIQVEEIILTELKEVIKKPKEARDIMSMPVKYISPDTTIIDAEEILTKYNINMVPVCENTGGKNKIIGLISRQNVEKADFHGFGKLPVKNFMTTEFYTVKPGSDIKEIKDLIFRGRQRLLPVINEYEEPIGVITRTDFLRILQDEKIITEKESEQKDEYFKNLRSLMKDLIDENIYERLVKIGEVAEALGYNAFLVGGIVRDLILRKKNLDIDIVVEGDGIRLANTVSKLLSVKVTEHKKFGTAHLIYSDGTKIDIATARIEYYPHPASLPTVEKGSLKLDLYRRDFTINTLAVKLNPNGFGELIDYFGGLRDLKEGMIRVLHNLSFVEDPTRVFRAVRFEVRFDFKISKHSLYLIKNAIKMNVFDMLSGNRLFSELLLILEEEYPEKIFDRLDELSLIQYIHRDLKWKKIKSLFIRAKEIIKWYELLYTGREVDKRIVLFSALFDGIEYAMLKDLVHNFSITGQFGKKILEIKNKENLTFEKLSKMSDESDVYFIFRDLSVEAIIFYMAKFNDSSVKKLVSRYFKEMINIKPVITGEDLIALGLKPSAIFTEIFEALIRAYIKGEVKNRDDEINLVKKMFLKNP
ncbi:MAG: CBS domain-containing protein [Proteobacteria bacterium]|nr:CBS domain-containing protein [Pseudomonadota bacterium]